MREAMATQSCLTNQTMEEVKKCKRNRIYSSTRIHYDSDLI